MLWHWDLDTQSRRTLGCHELAAQHSRLWRRTTAQCPACFNSIYGKVWKNLEHVHGLSTSSDSKATGEGKERRQTCCDTELCLPYTFCSSWCFLDKIPSLAIMRFCTPRLLCQGPSWIIKCVWSALPVPAESRKIARIFILWWSLFFSAPFFAGPVLEAHTSYMTLKPSHQNHVRFSATMGYNWSVWWEEARLYPYPYRGGGRGGTKPTCRIPLFFAWKPWDSDPPPRMEL